MRPLVCLLLALATSSASAQPGPTIPMDPALARGIGVALMGTIGPPLGAGSGLVACALPLFLVGAKPPGRPVMYGCAIAGSVAAAAGLFSVTPDVDPATRLSRHIGMTAGATVGFWTAYVLVREPIRGAEDAPLTAREGAALALYTGLAGAGAVLGDRIGARLPLGRSARRMDGSLQPTSGPDGGMGLRLNVRF